MSPARRTAAPQMQGLRSGDAVMTRDAALALR
jgi:hypothetical protein